MAGLMARATLHRQTDSRGTLKRSPSDCPYPE